MCPCLFYLCALMVQAKAKGQGQPRCGTSVTAARATTYCWQQLVNDKLRTWAPLLAKTEQDSVRTTTVASWPYRCWPWSGGCMLLARARLTVATVCVVRIGWQGFVWAIHIFHLHKSLAIGVGNIDDAAALTLSTHVGPDCVLCKPATFAHAICLGLSGQYSTCTMTSWPVSELCERADGNLHAASPFTQAMNDQAP
jgi:hypothetical protein